MANISYYFLAIFQKIFYLTTKLFIVNIKTSDRSRLKNRTTRREWTPTIVYARRPIATPSLFRLGFYFYEKLFKNDIM